MEYTRTRPGKVQIVPAPERVCPAGVEESATSLRLLGHDIRVGGRRLWGHGQVANINVVLSTVLEDLLSQCVAANQASAKKREGCAGFGKIHQHIIRRAAGPLRLSAD